MAINTIQLSLFVHQINALCGEMGAQLRHAAFSPNIRDRLDFSCAMFDERGQMCAQAAHIPVHLGSMAFAMQGIVSQFDWQPGDILTCRVGGSLPHIGILSSRKDFAGRWKAIHNIGLGTLEDSRIWAYGQKRRFRFLPA